jgi:hypothetical protein
MVQYRSGVDAVLEDFHTEEDRFLDAGSDRATSAPTGRCSVGRWRQGKCVWWGNFRTRGEALEAAGLSQQDVHA